MSGQIKKNNDSSTSYFLKLLNECERIYFPQSYQFDYLNILENHFNLYKGF